MTPLEEKPCGYPNCSFVTPHQHYTGPGFCDHEAIIKKAKEEERKRILDELPEEKPTDWDADRLTENIQTVCNDGFNECLSKVRNIISKPNI